MAIICVMEKKRKILLGIGVFIIVLGVYPAFVLGYTWSCVVGAGFKGGGNGPLDAYRHALASSVVSYTIGGGAVDIVTRLLEAEGEDANKMDRHNNQIGAKIGAESESFFDLEPSVREAVLDGAVNSTDLDQITWLREDKWRNRRFW